MATTSPHSPKALRIRRLAAVGAAASVLVGALAGCGDSQDGAPSDLTTNDGSSDVAISAVSPENVKQDEAVRALLPASIRESGVLKIGIAPGKAPHVFVNPKTNVVEGFEPDLNAAIAKVLGVKIDYTRSTFEGLIAGVNSGRFDLAQGNLGDNNLRQEQIDFVDYNWLTFGLQFPEGNPENIDSVYDLCGRTLGVTGSGTTILQNALKQCEEKGLPAAEYRIFPTLAELDAARASGRVSNASTEEIGLLEYNAKFDVGPKVDFIPAPEVGNLLEGFGLKKGSTELADALVAALQVLQQDGTYSQIFEKWAVPTYALDQIGINIGYKATNFIQTPA